MKTLKILFVLLAAILVFSLKTWASGGGLGLVLDGTAEVMSEKDDASTTLFYFMLKKNWEQLAEFVGESEKDAMLAAGAPPDQLEAWWGSRMAGALKAFETGQQLLKAIEKTQEGDYGEATLRVLYAGAEALNNPVVKLAASAGIYTHESYKAVQETGAARDIEALYGRVDSDRKLLGAQDPNSDSPKLVAITDENLQYFFDNYIEPNEAQDTDTRRLVKTYVKNRLGGTWPEAEWHRYVYIVGTFGSSTNPKYREEANQVLTTFKTQVFGWLRSLLEDVNTQAKVSWGQTRLRQLTPRLQAYMQQFGQAKDSFQRIKSEVAKLEKMKENLPEWKKVLADSPAQVEKARKMLADPKKISGVRGLCDTWISKMRTATSGASVIGEKALYAGLKAQQSEWYAIEKELEAATAKLQKDVAKDPSLVYVAAAGEDISDEKKFFQENFASLMKSFEGWVPSPDEAESSMQDKLNQGDFEGASALASQWDKNQEIFIKYYDYSKGVNILEAQKRRDAINEPLQNRINELNTEITSYSKEDEALRRDTIHDSEQANQFIFVNQKRETAQQAIKKLSADIAFCHAVFNQFVYEVNGALQNLTYTQWQGEGSKLARMRSFVYELQEQRRQQWSAFLSSVAEVEGRLPLKQLTGLENPIGSYNDQSVDEMFALLDKAETELKNAETFVVGAPFDYTTTLSTLYDQMNKRSWQVMGSSIETEQVTRALTNMENLFGQWIMAADSLKKIPQLSAQDLNDIRILVDREGADNYTKRKDAVEKAAILCPDLIAKIRGRANAYLEGVAKLGADRQQDSDWIQSKVREVQSFFKAQKELKVLKSRDNELDYELIISMDSDMGKTDSPYRHYMLEGDFASYVQNIESEWATYAGFQFLKKSAPKVYQKFMENLKPKGLKFAAEDNIIVRNDVSSVGMTVWQSVIEKFENAVSAVKYDASAFDFQQQILALTGVGGVPVSLKGSSTKSGYAVDESYTAFADDYNNALGKRFIAALGTLKKTLSDRDQYLASSTVSNGPGNGGNPSGGQAGQPSGQPGGQSGERPAGQPGAQSGGQPGAQLGGQAGEQTGARPGGQPAGQPAGQGTGLSQVGQPGGQSERGGRGFSASSMAAPEENTRGESRGGAVNYNLLNPRLNSVSLRNASGDVILAGSDLKDGAIEITARLSNLDNVAAILFSPDNGMSWTEVGLNQEVAASFVPIQDKRYQPLIKVKTTDYQEKTFKCFEDVSSIIYKDINYDELITATVKSIAEAYEKTNVSLFSDAVSRDYLGNKSTLVEGIRLDFDLFTAIRLIIYIDRIEKKADTFVAETKWDKTQTPRDGTSEQRTSGKTTMVFVLEDGKMKIKNLRGNLIYATLSPEIAQASGLPPATVDEVRTAEAERNPVQPGAGETEQQSDGVTSSSSLTVLHGSITSSAIDMPDNIHSFDFAAGTEGAFGGNDFNYVQTNRFMRNGSAEIQEVTTSTFEALDEAPTSGYGLDTFNMDVNKVYAFKTSAGLYGKLKVTSLVITPGVNDVIGFDYVVQTDGTTNVKSQ